jgi:hypothetical protein
MAIRNSAAEFRPTRPCDYLLALDRVSQTERAVFALKISKTARVAKTAEYLVNSIYWSKLVELLRSPLYGEHFTWKLGEGLRKWHIMSDVGTPYLMVLRR